MPIKKLNNIGIKIDNEIDIELIEFSFNRPFKTKIKNKDNKNGKIIKVKKSLIENSFVLKLIKVSK